MSCCMWMHHKQMLCCFSHFICSHSSCLSKHSVLTVCENDRSFVASKNKCIGCINIEILRAYCLAATLNKDASSIYDTFTHKNNGFMSNLKGSVNSGLHQKQNDEIPQSLKKYFISLPVISHIVLSFIIVSLYVRINYACRATNKAQWGT